MIADTVPDIYKTALTGYGKGVSFGRYISKSEVAYREKLDQMLKETLSNIEQLGYVAGEPKIRDSAGWISYEVVCMGRKVA